MALTIVELLIFLRIFPLMHHKGFPEEIFLLLDSPWLIHVRTKTCNNSDFSHINAHINVFLCYVVNLVCITGFADSLTLSRIKSWKQPYCIGSCFVSAAVGTGTRQTDEQPIIMWPLWCSKRSTAAYCRVTYIFSLIVVGVVTWQIKLNSLINHRYLHF